MSVEVRLPTLLRHYADGQATLSVEDKVETLREAFQQISKQYPALGGQLIADDGNLHKFMNVYVNDDDVRFLAKLETKVSAGDSITILPAVAGGAR